MATSVLYSWTWKSLIVDWSTLFTFYGKDFNPNVPTPSEWTKENTYASWETSFDLTWFAVGNEVCCCLFWFENNAEDNVYVSWDMYFQKSYNGSTYYYAGWSDSRWATVLRNWRYYYYYYAWIDDDEIWIWETYYRFHIEWSSTDGSTGTINIPFRVSNLSFDDSLHPSWYLWVEWGYLCYTDGTWFEMWNPWYWYKHRIKYDTGYDWWRWDPWYIWVGSWTTWRIYYTDAYWVVRRTHLADQWYGSRRYGTSWYIYVSDGDTQDGYWYLCFVDGNGELRRLWNWVP